MPEKRIDSFGALLKALETGDAPATLDTAALDGLRAELQALEKRAACGDRYREALCARIRKLSAVAQPELGAGLTAAIVKGSRSGARGDGAGAAAHGGRENAGDAAACGEKPGKNGASGGRPRVLHLKGENLSGF